MNSRDNFASSFRHSQEKNGSLYLVLVEAIALMSAAGRIASIAQGTDVHYRKGERPMIARRHATNGAWLAVNTALTGTRVRVLAGRFKNRSANVQYGPRNATNAELTGAVGAAAFGLIIGGCELVRGKSTLRGYRLSTFGYVSTAVSVVNLGAYGALSARELYMRREQWLPELKEMTSLGVHQGRLAVRRVEKRFGLREDGPIDALDLELAIENLTNQVISQM